MKRGYATEEHRDPAKAIRFDHELIGCAEELSYACSPSACDEQAAQAESHLSDDTQMRGNLSENMTNIPQPEMCTESSPEADESLCSAMRGERSPQAPKPPSLSAGVDAEIPEKKSYVATASLGEVCAPCKRVHFAPGPFEHDDSGDGHPDSSQVPRAVSNPYTPITYFPTEALTRHNLTAMENELGEEFKTENAASLVRLRRRLGLIPMAPIPRPYVTVPKAYQGARL